MVFQIESKFKSKTQQNINQKIFSIGFLLMHNALMKDL